MSGVRSVLVRMAPLVTPTPAIQWDPIDPTGCSGRVRSGYPMGVRHPRPRWVAAIADTWGGQEMWSALESTFVQMVTTTHVPPMRVPPGRWTMHPSPSDHEWT